MEFVEEAYKIVRVPYISIKFVIAMFLEQFFSLSLQANNKSMLLRTSQSTDSTCS